MRERVSAEIAVSAEDFSARGALVRLVIGVREEMRLQVGALIEAATANWTLVR